MILCSLSKRTRKRPSGKISSIRPSKVMRSSLAIRSGSLEIDRRFLATLVGFDLVADALVLRERAHAGAFYGADMNKAVLPAVVRRDEAEALVIIEEFYGAYWHGC